MSYVFLCICLSVFQRTPLILAAAGGEEDCAISLIEKGAKLKIKDFKGLNAKEWASKKSHQRYVYDVFQQKLVQDCA